MLQVDPKARGIPVVLSLVCLACVFIMLRVFIGAVTHRHKNYEMPTPVRN